MVLGKRIMIIGPSGSGKSTLARRLGGLLALPVIHLDKEFWNAGWVKTPREEWRENQRELLAQTEWIADGNFGSSLDLRLERADTAIFLDFGRAACLCGIIRRWLAYWGRTRPDMAEGCPEKIDPAFLKWIWDFPKNSRPGIVDALSKHRDVNVITLKNRRELERFADKLTRKIRAG